MELLQPAAVTRKYLGNVVLLFWSVKVASRQTGPMETARGPADCVNYHKRARIREILATCECALAAPVMRTKKVEKF